jgi:hypothetical protein
MQALSEHTQDSDLSIVHACHCVTDTHKAEALLLEEGGGDLACHWGTLPTAVVL